jgi:hypothetical protein
MSYVLVAIALLIELMNVGAYIYTKSSGIPILSTLCIVSAALTSPNCPTWLGFFGIVLSIVLHYGIPRLLRSKGVDFRSRERALASTRNRRPPRVS